MNRSPQQSTPNWRRNDNPILTGVRTPVTSSPLRAEHGTRIPKVTGSPQTPVPTVIPRREILVSSGASSTSKRNTEEGVATPSNTLISANITPRSGSRKARLGSTTSTPSGDPNTTPQRPRPLSYIGRSQLGSSETNRVVEPRPRNGIPDRPVRPRSVISNDRGSSLSWRSASPETSQQRSGDSSPLFFHATDTKSSDLKRPPLPARNSTFVYANGEEEASYIESPTTANPSVGDVRPQFFHADSMQPPATRESFAASQSSISSKEPENLLQRLAVSSLPKAALQHTPSTLDAKPQPPPQTQVKRTPSLSKASPRTHTRLVSSGGTHTLEYVAPEPQSPSRISTARRSSLSSPGTYQRNHTRSSSVTSAGSISNRRMSLHLKDSNVGVVNHARKPLPRMLSTVMSPAVEKGSYLESSQVPTENLAPSPPRSPVISASIPSSDKDRLEQQNELASNARRERKVLDLEISNSSLLAINQTLEKEMRKQKAELRRFRRLTLSGRLSMAPWGRSVSGKYSVLSSSDVADGESKMDNEYGYPYYTDDDDSSLLSDMTPVSPNSQISHGTRQHLNDEKRLQLDLSKQQALLQGSQKMNQCLQRCLNWTDDLIAGCKKALEYHVNVTAGGRVLAIDELAPDMTRSRGLLSPGLEEAENPLEAQSSFVRGEVDSNITAEADAVVGDILHPSPGHTNANEATSPNAAFLDGDQLSLDGLETEDNPTSLDDEVPDTIENEDLENDETTHSTKVLAPLNNEARNNLNNSIRPILRPIDKGGGKRIGRYLNSLGASSGI